MDGSFHAGSSDNFSGDARTRFGIDYTIKKEYNDEKTDKTILKEREDAHVPNGHYPAFYLIEPDYGILLLPEFNSSNLINHEKKSRKPREIAVFYLQLFRVNGIIY